MAVKKAIFKNNPCYLQNGTDCKILDNIAFDYSVNQGLFVTLITPATLPTSAGIIRYIMGQDTVTDGLRIVVKGIDANNAEIALSCNNSVLYVSTGVIIRPSTLYEIGVRITPATFTDQILVILLNGIEHKVTLSASSLNLPAVTTGTTFSYMSVLSVYSTSLTAKYIGFKREVNDVVVGEWWVNNNSTILYDRTGNENHLTLSGTYSTIISTQDIISINQRYGFNITKINGINRYIPSLISDSNTDCLGVTPVVYKPANGLLPISGYVDFTNNGENTDIDTCMSSYHLGDEPTCFGTEFFVERNSTGENKMIILKDTPASGSVVKSKAITYFQSLIYPLTNLLNRSVTSAKFNEYFKDSVFGESNNWNLYSPTVTFNGSDNYVSKTVTHGANATWEIELYFRMTSLPAGGRYIKTGTTSNERSIFYNSDKTLTFVINLTTNLTFKINPNLATTEFTKVYFKYVYTDATTYTYDIKVNDVSVTPTINNPTLGVTTPSTTAWYIGKRSIGTFVGIEFIYLWEKIGTTLTIDIDFNNLTSDNKVYDKASGTFISMSGTTTNCNTTTNLSDSWCYRNTTYVYSLDSDSTNMLKNLLVTKNNLSAAPTITGYTLIATIATNQPLLLNKHKLLAPNVASHKTADTSEVLYTSGTTPKSLAPSEFSAINVDYFFCRSYKNGSNVYAVDRLLLYSDAPAGDELTQIESYIADV